MTEQALAPRGSTVVTIGMDEADRAALRDAYDRLRRSKGVVVRAADLLAGMLGPAAAFGLKRLSVPQILLGKVQKLSEAAFRRAFDVAVLGMGTKADRRRLLPSLGERGGKLVAAASGAVTGFAGVAGFLPDVTLNTMLTMRQIAAIAVEEGEDLSTEDARRACLCVFAFDQPGPAAALGSADESEPELRYWTARLIIQARPLTMLLSEIAASYGLRVSQKFALQAAPVIGAAGAAVVNSVFLDHYQNLARAHFTIRRLERRYGTEQVRAAWGELA